MKLSKGCQFGIDAGSGAMLNRKFFRSRYYMAIDVDEDSLREGKAKYPEALTFNGPIEAVPCNATANFVLCVQVITPKLLRRLTMPIVRALTRMVKPDGTLIFNVSRGNLVYEAEIDGLLADTFRKVKKTRYGWMMGYDGVLGPVIALFMYMFPMLRYGRNYAKVYYVCRGRI